MSKRGRRRSSKRRKSSSSSKFTHSCALNVGLKRFTLETLECSCVFVCTRALLLIFDLDSYLYVYIWFLFRSDVSCFTVSPPLDVRLYPIVTRFLNDERMNECCVILSVFGLKMKKDLLSLFREHLTVQPAGKSKLQFKRWNEGQKCFISFGEQEEMQKWGRGRSYQLIAQPKCCLHENNRGQREGNEDNHICVSQWHEGFISKDHLSDVTWTLIRKSVTFWDEEKEELRVEAETWNEGRCRAE